MDVDKARAEGRCFKCGKVGHIPRNCPDRKVQVRVAAIVETEEKRQEDFQDTQQ